MTRTRVPRWAPTFLEALRLAAKPAIAYFVFCVLGMIVFFGTLLYYRHDRSTEFLSMGLACAAGLAGVVLGQLVAILRARSFPVFAVGIGFILGGVWLMASSGAANALPKDVVPAIVFFCFAFPCGMLSLQHRWELFASFWPAVGFIGAVFGILNEEGRVHAWEQEKVTAWLPVPLVFLACFLVLWLFYLASKQAMRVELWQSLSGAAARRVTKRATVHAVPRKNVLPLLAAAVVLFGVVAVLAPYLWRTGKGDREGKHGKPDTSQVDDGDGHGRGRRPSVDGEAIVQQMKQLAEAAKNTVVKLWPLLLLFLLYRPVKRALLETHLVTPVVPAPPTERIENLWEYVRIAAEDAGVVPAPSDSVEQLLARIRAAGKASPALEDAARIYARTRYGFAVARGDANAMRPLAVAAARGLRAGLSTTTRAKNLWRALS